jgi:hypothetical protein
MKTFTAVALAAALVSSQAQAAFQNGWNKIYILNCVTITTDTTSGTSGVNNLVAQSAGDNSANTNLQGVAKSSSSNGTVVSTTQNNSVLWVLPDTTRTAGLTSADTFSTTDPIYVTALSPFCISGAPFYVHFVSPSPAIWDSISVYPGLK